MIDDDGSEDMWTATLTCDSKCSGGYYKDYIAHIVLDYKAKEHLIKRSFEQLVYDGKYSKISRTMNDHYPISVELNL